MKIVDPFLSQIAGQMEFQNNIDISNVDSLIRGNRWHYSLPNLTFCKAIGNEHQALNEFDLISLTQTLPKYGPDFEE